MGIVVMSFVASCGSGDDEFLGRLCVVVMGFVTGCGCGGVGGGGSGYGQMVAVVVTAALFGLCFFFL